MHSDLLQHLAFYHHSQSCPGVPSTSHPEPPSNAAPYPPRRSTLDESSSHEPAPCRDVSTEPTGIAPLHHHRTLKRISYSASQETGCPHSFPFKFARAGESTADRPKHPPRRTAAQPPKTASFENPRLLYIHQPSSSFEDF